MEELRRKVLLVKRWVKQLPFWERQTNVDVVDLELEDLVVVAAVDLEEAVDHLLNEEDLEGLDEDPHLRSDKEPLSRVRCDFYSGCFSFSFLVK